MIRDKEDEPRPVGVEIDGQFYLCHSKVVEYVEQLKKKLNETLAEFEEYQLEIYASRD